MAHVPFPLGFLLLSHGSYGLRHLGHEFGRSLSMPLLCLSLETFGTWVVMGCFLYRLLGVEPVECVWLSKGRAGRRKRPVRVVPLPQRVVPDRSPPLPTSPAPTGAAPRSLKTYP